MARNRRAESGSFSSIPMNSQPTTRRRPTPRDLHPNTHATDGETITPKVINAAPSLEKAQMYGIEDARPATSKIMGWAGRFVIETLPQWLTVGAMLALIFGGCCSNVFALEAIVKVEPDTGTLLTFVQFVFVAVTGYFSQFDSSRPPFFLRPNRVPIRRWIVNIILFFAINVLNNHAFSYDISVPVHIILRSGGSITTITAGYLFGKKYTRIQAISVIFLTIGVIVAAWSDAQTKETPTTKGERLPSFSTGLVILFIAQVLSAIMGLYTEDTYRKYGPHWKENLFYSHLLSLPLFIPFIPSMHRQFTRLAASQPLQFLTPENTPYDTMPQHLREGVNRIHVPSQLAFLVTNVLTQYACIRGVNLLAAGASALTVTIVLNVRKLLSLLLSIWLFGNNLSPGTLVGAFIVFGSGALYSMDGGRNKARAKHRATQSNGKIG